MVLEAMAGKAFVDVKASSQSQVVYTGMQLENNGAKQ
jgi:hypothetical protein